MLTTSVALDPSTVTVAASKVPGYPLAAMRMSSFSCAVEMDRLLEPGDAATLWSTVMLGSASAGAPGTSAPKTTAPSSATKAHRPLARHHPSSEEAVGFLGLVPALASRYSTGIEMVCGFLELHNGRWSLEPPF